MRDLAVDESVWKISREKLKLRNRMMEATSYHNCC